MLKAVLQKGNIVPKEPVPPEWEEGASLEVAKADVTQLDLDASNKTVSRVVCCPNGHSVPDGETVCPTCHTFVDGTVPAPPSGATLPQVCDYEVLQELGRGAMGVVYQARDKRLNRLVALKMMILRGVPATENQRTRFVREAKAVASLQHPNVVQLHEIGETEGKELFFSLEFVEGDSLDKRLRGTPLTPRQAVRLVLVLAKAIHCAHEQGVVHRDLKPGNILIAGDGQLPVEDWTPKIADFGLAKLLNEVEPLTFEAPIGTPSYMAPEQAAGKIKDIGPLCDVYALGAILYEMLTGRPPFKGATAQDTMNQVQTRDPVPPSHLQKGVKGDLETICMACLEREPSRRYASALDLAEDLRRYQAHEPIIRRPVSRAEFVWLLCKRNPLPATLTAFLVIVSLVGFGLVTWKWLDAANQNDAKQAALRRAADLAFGQGLNFCEQENVKEGMSWFVHSLEIAPDYNQLDLSVRHQLAFWQTHLPTLKDKPWKEPSKVNLATFTPQGKRLFLARDDNTIICYDVSTGKECWKYKQSSRVDKWFFEPSGEKLLTLGKDNTLQLLYVHAERQPHPVHRELHNVPGRLLAVAFRNKEGPPHMAFVKKDKVVISDWASESEIPSEAVWQSASFDKRGHRVLIRSSKAVECWQLSPKLQLKFKASDDLVKTLSFDGAKEEWASYIARLQKHITPIKDAAISPNGKQVLAAYADGKIQLWNCETGAQVFGDEDVENSHPNVSKVMFGPTGKQFLSASHENLTLWNADGTKISPLRIPRSVTDGFGFIGTDAEDGPTAVFVNGTASGFLPGRISTGGSAWSRVPFRDSPMAVGPSRTLAFTADESRTLAFTTDENGNCSFWEVAIPPVPNWIKTRRPIEAATFTGDGTGLRLFFKDLPSSAASVVGLIGSPGGHGPLLAVSAADKLLEQRWDLETMKPVGQPVLAEQQNPKWSHKEDISADERWCVSIDQEESIDKGKWLRFSDGGKHLGPKVYCGTVIKTVQFHPDTGKVHSDGRKRQVLIVSNQGRVGLFDIPPQMPGTTDEIRCYFKYIKGLVMDAPTK